MSGLRTREGTSAKVYLKHLKNLKEATAKVDNSAPRLPVSVYIKDGSYFADLSRLRNVEQLNREMLKQINVLYRTKGRVDCQLEKYARHKTVYRYKLQELEKQRKINTEFLAKLDPKFMKSDYNQVDSLKQWKKMLKVMRFTARYPEFYDKKPSHLATWSPCPANVAADPTARQVCFLELQIGDLPRTSRVDIEVYNDVVPATAANFVALCQGFGDLSYKGSVFHRIVPDFFCIGGDIVNHSGTGGISIYGPSFPDENFLLQHNGPGTVAMYSSQPDSNHSQFLITFKKLSTLNGKYVVIGRVKSSYQVLTTIESCGTKGGKPLQRVEVVNCGVYGQPKKEAAAPVTNTQHTSLLQAANSVPAENN